MPKTREQKEHSVQELTDKLAKSKSVVFTNYKGLTMGQLSGLRKSLKDLQAQLEITKNNLLKIALDSNKIDVVDQKTLEGPTATLFSFDDEITPIKALTKAFKDYGIGEVKGGLLGTEFIGAGKVQQLATLPSKDQLRGQVVGTLGSPLYGIVGVLQANLRNLVYVVDQIRKQKGGDTQVSS
ncbi:MAG: 50S ribosomal protein L10 [Candidatus Daviesbacteria bacterium GW2011_GWA2_38_24]|uniref:Large ribosomal subunit protein uL10 n=1 Tax=Candidatus Daviesbacteria bacterium GW2011_GWA2_38_24 TaxID=1618422 RepID=A0A0G0MMB8_9BACT|nr:MAG: 50S ribosomal protein L10 [Candidatus Daviesbacteria bacterium GW2011_GWA2_38_24]KKQ78772.1 MAG: 50S ribosomal protein L10 [Candidatus Daviesbacteria bacterium GW2011_GWA1_38_7]